jgi:hypothetical protein
MTELRFVSREGDYLVFESISGERFRVPVDESIRDGVRQTAKPVQGTSPKYIQSRIRQGATVAQIANETGEPEAYIELFAATVLDELRYLLDTALAVALPDGPNMASFQTLIERRAGTCQWNIARPSDAWILSGEFDSGLATWTFDPKTLSLEPANSLARDLSRSDRDLVADTRPLRTVSSPSTTANEGGTDHASLPTAASDLADAHIDSNTGVTAPAASVLDLVAERKLREGAEASKPASAKGRASLPSWDEIVLGAGGPEEEF